MTSSPVITEIYISTRCGWNLIGPNVANTAACRKG